MNRIRFGNARQLRSGRWQARYWWHNVRYIGPGTFPTEAKALAWLKSQQAMRERERAAQPATAAATVGAAPTAAITCPACGCGIRLTVEPVVARRGPIRQRTRAPEGTRALQHDSAAELYQQLADDLQARIRAGEYTGRVPSIPALAAEYGVSRDTAQRALQALAQVGEIVRSRGRGYWVTPTGICLEQNAPQSADSLANRVRRVLEDHGDQFPDPTDEQIRTIARLLP